MPRGKRVELVKIAVDGAEVGAKACTKCGEVKALGEFPPDRRASDGRQSRCRVCSNQACKDTLRKKAKTTGRTIKGRTHWTAATYAEHVSIITEGEYGVLGDYVKSSLPVQHIHFKCGQPFPKSPNDFLGGHRCTKCSLTAKIEAASLTHGEYVQKLDEVTGGEYTIVGAYRRSVEKVDHRHNICGHTWPVAPSNILRGSGCPLCSESRGERVIRNYLQSRSYIFTSQYRFDDCRSTNPLPFDFAVHLPGGDTLIEYDGEQHFRPRPFGGSEEDAHCEFIQTQRRDRIKTEYCRANGIPLIRINYTQFDEIEAILDRELSALGITGKCPTQENGGNTEPSAGPSAA